MTQLVVTIQTHQQNTMDAVKSQLQVLRSKLDKIPALEKAEVSSNSTVKDRTIFISIFQMIIFIHESPKQMFCLLNRSTLHLSPARATGSDQTSKGIPSPRRRTPPPDIYFLWNRSIQSMFHHWFRLSCIQISPSNRKQNSRR